VHTSPLPVSRGFVRSSDESWFHDLSCGRQSVRNRTHEMCRLVWALVSNYDGHVLRFLEPSKEAFTRAFQFGSTFFLIERQE
jgi:hypothetical protein